MYTIKFLRVNPETYRLGVFTRDFKDLYELSRFLHKAKHVYYYASNLTPDEVKWLFKRNRQFNKLYNEERVTLKQ